MEGPRVAAALAERKIQHCGGVGWQERDIGDQVATGGVARTGTGDPGGNY